MNVRWRPDQTSERRNPRSWGGMLPTSLAPMVDARSGQTVFLFPPSTSITGPRQRTEAVCARQGCAARLASSRDGEQQALFHSGLAYDQFRRLWRLTAHASRQWKAARREGVPWHRFWPKARRRSDASHESLAELMPELLADLPAKIRCPLCGFLNEV